MLFIFLTFLQIWKAFCEKAFTYLSVMIDLGVIQSFLKTQVCGASLSYMLHEVFDIISSLSAFNWTEVIFGNVLRR